MPETKSTTTTTTTLPRNSAVNWNLHDLSAYQDSSFRASLGSGKTTIASTIASLPDSDNNGLNLGLGSLGATFICNRDDDTLNQPSLMFPTIAFHLACTYPLLRAGILATLTTHPDIGDSAIANQFWELILIRISPSFKIMLQHPCPSEALDLVLEPTGQQRLDALHQTDLVQVLQQYFTLIYTILGCLIVSRMPLSMHEIPIVSATLALAVLLCLHCSAVCTYVDLAVIHVQ